MGRGDEVDVMDSFHLELYKCVGKIVDGYLSAMTQLTQRVVLAVTAAEVASAEKNCS